MGASLETGKEARRAGDYALAIEHLTPLAEFGVDEAKYELALVTMRQKDSSFEEYQKARTMFLEVKGRRKAAALFEVARIYERGKGVKKDVSKAKDYYKASAEMGYQRSNYELADILVDERDYAGAKELCEYAFNNRYNRAAMCLGNLYEKGFGTSQNLQKALAWYLVAERRNVSRADNKVKELSARLNSKSVSSAATLSMGLEKNE